MLQGSNKHSPDGVDINIASNSLVNHGRFNKEKGFKMPEGQCGQRFIVFRQGELFLGVRYALQL
eukprot:gene6680-6904_t